MNFTNVKKLNYTHKQEVWNALSHLLGLLFSIAIAITFIVIEVKYEIPFSTMYVLYIYAFTMSVVFFVSFFYHAQPLNTKIKGVCRIIDHADIYLLIAGTYTPICVLAITNQAISITLLALQWSLTLLGILITVFGLGNKAYDIAGYVIYVIQGWALMLFYPFNQCMPFDVFIYILMGGVAYSIGAILYAVGKKNTWFHTVFHIFILLGAVIQFVGIYNAIM